LRPRPQFDLRSLSGFKQQLPLAAVPAGRLPLPHESQRSVSARLDGLAKLTPCDCAHELAESIGLSVRPVVTCRIRNSETPSGTAAESNEETRKRGKRNDERRTFARNQSDGWADHRCASEPTEIFIARVRLDALNVELLLQPVKHFERYRMQYGEPYRVRHASIWRLRGECPRVNHPWHSTSIVVEDIFTMPVDL
jgi:hypothetical protein